MALDPQQQIDFDRALAFVLGWEGGYTNDPDDSGGPTNLGIIQREYSAYRVAHSKPIQSVRHIEHGEAVEIYLTKYWLAPHCGLLHWPANAILFDGCVNTGLGQGVKFLQRALGVVDDGQCGMKTQAAMAVCDTAKVAASMIQQREAFYRSLAEAKPSQKVFLKGWLARVEDAKTL